MISYEAINDAVTALLIVLFVSMVIGLAWLSTNVREQPLVAFVVIHSSDNGEREHTHQERNTSNRETQESGARERESLSGEISSSHREVGMEVTKIANEESIGEFHSKESAVAGKESVRHSKETIDTNHPQIERVGNIFVKEVGNSESGSPLLQSHCNKGEDGVEGGLFLSHFHSNKGENKGDSSQEVNQEDRSARETSYVCPPSEPPLQKKADIIPETELRKRRLQQFISMGDTTTTTHLERLSEQLTATLPSEVSNGSVEEKKSMCSESAKVAESVFSEGAKVQESLCSEGAKVPESICSEGANIEDPIFSEGAKVPESICSEDPKVEEVSSCECSGADEAPSSLNLFGDAESAKEVEEERPPGSIKIRLKFLDETQRHVFAHLTEQVGSFKRQHFSIEMDANRRIRLIFNGQLLSQDTSTLAQYGLFDNCVVHCHVSQPQQNNTTNSREAAAQNEEDAYVSRLLAPLLYGVLAVMWYLRFEYGHLFNAMSTIILLFLTALLLVSTYLLYVTNHIPNPALPATTSTTTRLPQTQVS